MSARFSPYDAPPSTITTRARHARWPARNERRAGSKYASIENCRYEVNEAETMMKREGIRWLSSTTKSIEEIVTTILQEIKPDRRGY